MNARIWFLSALGFLSATAAMALAQTQASSPVVDRIKILIRQRDGQAYCVFQRDGTAEGGHLSGGSQPVVHQDRRTLPAEKTEAIWAAVKNLDPGAYGKAMSPDTQWKGSVELLLFEGDRAVTRLAWPFGEEFPDEKVRELVRLLYQNRIGGW